MTSNSKSMPSNDAFFLLDPTPLFQTPVSKKRILPSSNPSVVRKVARPTKMSSSASTRISPELLFPLAELESRHQSRATFSLKRKRSSEANELEQCFPPFDYERGAVDVQESLGDIAKNVTPLTPRVRIDTPTIATPMRKKIRTIKNIITP